ncbi:MAG: type II/IV secretion system protein [Gemmatimonadota bacterium]|nr:type II/IV secretion system protein [Gemmatimonadota bacterium]MDQ8176506.1 type II/IV secretion system protein [Gemmatimonadota bacterium]
MSVWEAVLERKWLADEEVADAVAARYRLKRTTLTDVDPRAKDFLPEGLARKYQVVPLAVTDSAVDIGTADPLDLDAERAIAFALGRQVRMQIASPREIVKRLETLYRERDVLEEIVSSMTGSYEVQAIDEAAEDSELDIGIDRSGDRPVIQLVDRIIAEGIRARASDIHLEPEETGVAVRYRIDGVLRQVMVLPKAAKVPLASRIKIMAQLDIADRLRPQDGRARVAVGGNRVDLRVSTLPAAQGEKVVIRILDQRSTVLSLDSLGLLEDERTRIDALLDAREGIVLVTGPTGSGKTTTLYSMLRAVQARGVNIVTVEDPVEYRLPGIVQVQVNEKAGLTFPSALRSILRQDPDVILVGEIRDHETATIAVQASLTGHLVLSTLHTNDAVSAVTRLVDIGVESYKIAAALKGVVAQRLMRRLCPACSEPAPDDIPDRLRRFFPNASQVRRAVGCADCSMTGYRGRLAIEEVLTVSEEVGRRIGGVQPLDRIADAAREAGLLSLWESGVEHVCRGETTVVELLRVLEAPPEALPSAGTPIVEAPSASGPQVVTAPPASESAPRPRGVTPPRGLATDGRENPSVSGPSLRSGTRHAVPKTFSGDAFDLLDDPSTAPRTVRTLLIVEDEEALRRVMKDLLEREGFRVFEAADGVTALEELDRHAPDLMVLDLNLPRLDGYGVLSHLRARPATAKLPVIVLTAKGDEESEVRVFEFGATDYLTKPFRARALSARIHAILERTAGKGA